MAKIKDTNKLLFIASKMVEIAELKALVREADGLLKLMVIEDGDAIHQSVIAWRERAREIR